MEDRKYRVYTEEFKLEVLELLKRGGKGAGLMEVNGFSDIFIVKGMLTHAIE